MDGREMGRGGGGRTAPVPLDSSKRKETFGGGASSSGAHSGRVSSLRCTMNSASCPRPRVHAGDPARRRRRGGRAAAVEGSGLGRRARPGARRRRRGGWTRGRGRRPRRRSCWPWSRSAGSLRRGRGLARSAPGGRGAAGEREGAQRCACWRQRCCGAVAALDKAPHRATMPLSACGRAALAAGVGRGRHVGSPARRGWRRATCLRRAAAARTWSTGVLPA